MTRNPDYFKPGLPYLDELVFRIIPQAATQVAALERGEVDYLSGVPGPDLARLQQSDRFTLTKSGAGSGGSFCITTLIFNLERANVNKVEVRQALAHAIDRKKMLGEIHFGQGKVATAAISSAIGWAHNPKVQQYPLDTAKANVLLDQAGLARGADGMRFKVIFVHSTGFAKYGELMKADLAKVGVDVQLEALEVNAASSRTFIKRDFDLGFASYCNGPDPEIGVRRMYVSSNIGPILFSNGAAYRNATVDGNFDKAVVAVEKADRAKAYFEIQRRCPRSRSSEIAPRPATKRNTAAPSRWTCSSTDSNVSGTIASTPSSARPTAAGRVPRPTASATPQASSIARSARPGASGRTRSEGTNSSPTSAATASAMPTCSPSASGAAPVKRSRTRTAAGSSTRRSTRYATATAASASTNAASTGSVRRSE